MDVHLRQFDDPDEIHTFEKGKFEIVRIGAMIVGRATYAPGWEWSTHVGATLGKKSCDVEHVGMVVAGRIVVSMEDGRTKELAAGDLFHIAPGHDAWVVGDEPYISLHLTGTSDYAKQGRS